MNSLAGTISMGQRRSRSVTVQFRLDDGFGTDQQHADAVLASCKYGALDFWLRRTVRTHRIQRDNARHGYELAGFLDVEHFASFIVPAFRAGSMRHFLLVAIGAFRK